MRALIYLQLHRGHFIVKRIDSGETVRQPCAVLDDPRLLVRDPGALETRLTQAIKPLLPRLRLLAPRGLLHLLPETEGEYSQEEMVAFKDAAEASGVDFNHLSTLGRAHTDEEVRKVLA